MYIIYYIRAPRTCEKCKSAKVQKCILGLFRRDRRCQKNLHDILDYLKDISNYL